MEVGGAKEGRRREGRGKVEGGRGKEAGHGHEGRIRLLPEWFMTVPADSLQN